MNQAIKRENKKKSVEIDSDDGKDDEVQEPALEEIDLEKIAREALDPNSVKCSDSTLKKIFREERKFKPREPREREPREGEERKVPQCPTTKKGKVSKTMCEIDKIYVLTQSFESTFIWLMHNQLINVIPKCEKCEIPFKLVRNRDYIYDTRCYRCPICEQT